MLAAEQFAAEKKAQASAANTISAGIVRPHEAVKDAILLCCRDADAVILNRPLDQLLLCVCVERDPDSAAIGTVFDGVIDDVCQHLLHALRINIDNDRPFIGEERKKMPLGGYL